MKFGVVNRGVLQNAHFYNLTPIPTATAAQALLLHNL